MNSYAFPFAIAMVGAVGVLSAGAPSKQSIPKLDKTQNVLMLLMTQSEDEIPEASSCKGRYGQIGRARVKDLLAMELATLSRGHNSVVGACDPNGLCSLTISHAFEEDVSSARIRFSVKDGRVNLASLACVLSP